MARTMNNQYWNSLAKSFTDDVLEISSYDRRGVLKEEIARAAKGARAAADLGCGAGGLLELLSSNFQTVNAVDYAAELLEQARQRYQFPNVKYTHHNLAGGKPLAFKADVTFCVNALISPSDDQRRKIARCVWQTTKPNGLSIFVVPSFESVIHVYRTLIRCETRDGEPRSQAVRQMDNAYRQDVKSSVDGILDVGGMLTKCFTQEELAIFLSDTGYQVERVRKIEYSWSEEIENVPRWLKEPYPWDWFALARKM